MQCVVFHVQQVGAISERNIESTASGIRRPRSLDTENDEGTEMKIIEPRRPVQIITQACFNVAQQQEQQQQQQEQQQEQEQQQQEQQ